MADSLVLKPDREFIGKIKASGGDTFQKCYQCSTCAVTCELSPEERPFPRKEMLYAQMGLKDKLLTDPDIWLCHRCNDCSQRCPRDAKPGEILAAIRSTAMRYFAFPGFMGKALASPRGLLPLLLIPILVIGALMWGETNGNFAPLLQASVVDFDNFIPHGWVEMLFIAGNLLIFTFAAIGLIRFWKGMDRNNPYQAKVGFIPAVVKAGLDIVLHGWFGRCGAASYRRISHILIFFGFGGALIATAGAVGAIFLFDYHPPYPLRHPIKIFGNLGGIAIILGLAITIVQRSARPDDAGSANYGMNLFLWVIGLAAITGMGSQFLRIAEVPAFAYPVYFAHLVMVFFLLWYAPYSQFAHIFYRTLAMIYAAEADRRPKNLKLVNQKPNA